MTTAEPAGVLYRRHRPGRFDQLVGQPQATAILRGALARGTPPHAWLFYGPRGTGKTTSARILAAALCCLTPGPDGEPCGKCSSCEAIPLGDHLDVVEVDAASHSGVDAIRELCGTAQLAPVGSHRVFVLDEVHMLSNAASNALLKTLEEPPPQVTFILATTDAHKVPDTVRSRCVTVPFRLIPDDAMTGLCEQIRTVDHLDASDEMIAAAVRAGGGSVRDTLSALEGLLAGGTDQGPDVEGLLDAIAGGNIGDVLTEIHTRCAEGSDPRELIEATAAGCRDRFLAIMAGTASGPAAPVVAGLEGLGEAMARIAGGWDTRVALELSLIRALRRHT